MKLASLPSGFLQEGQYFINITRDLGRVLSPSSKVKHDLHITRSFFFPPLLRWWAGSSQFEGRSHDDETEEQAPGSLPVLSTKYAES
jgi:hypothetical protein